MWKLIGYLFLLNPILESEGKMIGKTPSVKVAVVQAAPVLFNWEATVDKACRLTADAAAQDAKLILFPEAFIPAYPRGLSFGSVVGSRKEEGRRTWQRCGDCTLSEMAFLCPQSQCPKFLFNGQCGGSREGWCEVFPGKKKCIYVRAYERLKAYREEESMKDGYIPPRNWELNGTSSWVNYFLGRDHQGINR